MKTIKESPYYKIDKEGEIYNLEGKKLMGKYQLNLKMDDGFKTFYRKNVVANNLIPNPNNYPHIIHKDGDDTNFHPSNLIWSKTLYGEPIFDKRTDCYLRTKIGSVIGNCYGKNNTHTNYRKQGIKVCKQWREDTLEFIKWSKKNGYYKGAWLIRYDKGKGYNPDNCFWGERDQCFKLNCEMVESIKENKDFNNKEIAEKYQISYERARQIKTGRTLQGCN